MWKVDKGEQHFYLFGTMHLADPDLQTLPKALSGVIDQSDFLRTEISMEIGNQLKASSLMLRKDGKKLKDILPSPLYKRAETYLKGINPILTLEPFDDMKIWAVSTIITLLENQLKYPMMPSIDKVIYNYAKKEKKDVGGVETIEEQFSAMDSFTLKEQILGLESSLDYLEKEVDVSAEMKELYMKGDSTSMMKFINSMMFKIPKYKDLEKKFMEELLYKRNIRMVSRIEKLLAKTPKKKFVFAFGVMHFLGEKSVIDGLKSHGYSIKRVVK